MNTSFNFTSPENVVSGMDSWTEVSGTKIKRKHFKLSSKKKVDYMSCYFLFQSVSYKNLN